jgi:hypothetical protein
MDGRMMRASGVLLLVLLLLLGAALRRQEAVRSEHLLAGEAAARSTLVELHAACQDLVRDGRPRPDLARAAFDAVPGLRPLPELGSDGVAYAADDAYVYGLAGQSRRDERTGRFLPGWILRAWPVRFGGTGNREYQLTDDGTLWEGQNRLGRSGTDYGFPPDFPDPDVGQPRTPWWPVELPHR